MCSYATRGQYILFKDGSEFDGCSKESITTNAFLRYFATRLR